MPATEGDFTVAEQQAPLSKKMQPELVAVEASDIEVVDLDEPIAYIVQLVDAPLALYKGNVPGLTATNPAARGANKLDAKSPDGVAYMSYLDQKRGEAIAGVNQALGRSIKVNYEYKATLHGFATEMTAAEAALVAKLPGVRHVEKVIEYELHTDAGPTWMGAPGIWDGTMTGGLLGTMGEDIIVGVIDTGIDPWNPSFADVGGDGYDHTNPWGAGAYVGVCDPADPSYDATFPCNDKLIGAWGYASVQGGDPRDEDGHGSHTSSTAAGNFVYGAVITTTDGSVFSADISGVAPHANVVMYAACCTGDALAAAKDQVVLDGVDVVNYSIGGGSTDPWSSTDAQQWLAIREAGIYAATSAGNAGPGSETVGSPGDAPWIMTVGASSHDRAFLNTLVMTNGNPLSPTVTIEGQSMTGALITMSQIVLSSWYTASGTIDPDDARLCADDVFPPGTFNDEIVVCERGVYGRVAKGQTVADGGAGGYILAQPDEFGGGPGAVAADPHVLPGVHIDYYEYQALLAYLDSAPVVSGTIAGSVKDVDPDYADIMAAFSSRGSNASAPDVIVPSVTGPGRAVWAAYQQGTGGDGDYTYNVIGGTSMSSPHVAGALALLKALHPTWSPAQAQSALMTTARNTVLDADGVTVADPFAQGSGHPDLNQAALAGFVLDVTGAEYTAADPSLGGDPATLNLASMAEDLCLGNCTWTREVESTLSYSVTWTAEVTGATGLTLTVAPASFMLAPGATQMITVEADVRGLPTDGDWSFGEVMLTPAVTPPTMTTAIEYTDTNVGAPTWDRPATLGDGTSGSCILWTEFPFNGNLVFYHEYSTTLGISNSISISSVQDYNGYLHLYDSSFDDTDPCLGLIALNDNGPGGNRTSEISAVAQDSGVYYIITSGWNDSDTGTFTNTITVVITPSTPPDAHFPVAVMPSTGVLPDLVEVKTRRNAGSQLIEGLETIEVTDLTVDLYGLAQADLTSDLLMQDPTNGDAYDAFGMTSGAFYVTHTLAGDLQLIAEVITSTAPYLELFVGQDLDGDGPEASEQACASTTGSWSESCTIDNPADGVWWILVQNWGGSGAQPDEVTLATAVVPSTSNGNMMVTGPSSVLVGTLYDLRLYWDTPAMIAGDRWYGTFALGTDSGNPGNIGAVPVVIYRDDDDVTKQASATTVYPDDMVTFTIEVQANVTPEDLAYTITDTIPAGLTYVPDSATGGATVVGDQLTWSGVQAVSGELVEITYEATVDAGTWGQVLTNDVQHDTDNPGSMPASDSVDVTVADAPEFAWDKLVYVNDVMVGDIGSPITVFPNDTVVIVDQVDITYTAGVSFELLEEWDDSLELVGYELPPGSLMMPGIDVMTTTSSLTWMVTDLSADLDYVITKTFSVAADDWDVDLLTETLTVEYVAMQPDPVVLRFEHGGVNSPPVAVDDLYTTFQDLPLTVSAAGGVLYNDYDVDGDPLTAMWDSGPSNGTLDFNPDGSFVYTPSLGFSGSDSFSYHADDGLVASDTAIVTITVNYVPSCEDVSGVTLDVDPGTLYMGNTVAFSADIEPDTAGTPYNYTINYGDGTDPTTSTSSDDPLAFSHVFTATGTFSVTFSVWNCDMTVEEAVSDTLPVDIDLAGYNIYLPLVAKNYGG